MAKAIVFFDGECRLCDGAVTFILDHERDSSLEFAALQTEVAHRLLTPLGYDTAALPSVALVADGRLYLRSDAVIAIARHLRWPYPWLGAFSWVPKALRDAAYNFVAAHRYRWFGKTTCRVPTAALSARFLTDDTVRAKAAV